MQEVILEEPYEFIPPVRSTMWTHICRPLLPFYLKKSHGIVDVEVRGTERLKKSLDAEHGVILMANHCRTSDPMTMGSISRAVPGQCLYTMASFHLFRQGWFQPRMMRRLGAFSILREGADRAALNFAIDNLTRAERPLVIYPEGTVSRANDILLPFLDGPAFMARTAAKRRQKEGKGPVVIHPTVFRYIYLDNVEETVTPVVREIEQRLSWTPQEQLPLVDRIRKLGSCLLAVKEIEYLGAAQEGELFDRAEHLAEKLLAPHEKRFETATGPEDHVVMRVKAIRTKILPELTSGKLKPDEKADRYEVLRQIYLAQQAVFYPRDYLTPDSPPEHIVETVERFEEDLTDKLRVFGRMKTIIEIGEPIEVGTEKPPRGEKDPVIVEAREQMYQKLAALADEVAASRAKKES
ncbi:lysophospholipid acyltransferase family protein [Stratiformator vulcanicus]|uniref:Acyltransferase n=1 Tax=Stratiformator vulcanicus TaxID=2527980 RepID=A0A517R5G0_9PLAN|nr:lysophospholipid acyltransferase family protein [Stratiformator vulcanicus]QDT39090.1 Acyltransferase [Stratiformator vulcanicus]